MLVQFTRESSAEVQQNRASNSSDCLADTLLTMVHIVKAMVFPVVMYGSEHLTVKKAEYKRTVVLEKTPESLLDSKEIKPVNPKGNQP